MSPERKQIKLLLAKLMTSHSNLTLPTFNLIPSERPVQFDTTMAAIGTLEMFVNVFKNLALVITYTRHRKVPLFLKYSAQIQANLTKQ